MNSKLLPAKFFVCALIALLAFSQYSYAQIQVGLDIDGEAGGDEFGHSVSMPDATTVAIGSRYNNGNGSDAGHVRVYQWNGSNWVQKGMDLNGEAANDHSGCSVSMPDATTVAVGAYYNDGNGIDAGHVRVYEWNGSDWTQKGVDIDGEAADDRAGHSVSMPDANTVAIGAFRNSGNGLHAGHVRIFEWDGSAWVQKGMDIDGEAIDDYSGTSVSMPDANTVAIAAYLNAGNGSQAGHVRVYEWSGSAWVQKGMDIDGEAANSASGRSVSMPNANTVAIGAGGNGPGIAISGQVQVHEWNGSTWAQIGQDIDGEATADYSGWSVSMPDPTTVAIGAYGNDGNGYSAGHVRVYKRNGNSWLQQGMDIDGEAPGDASGYSVSMSNGSTVAIGAYGNDVSGLFTGHVRLYKLKGVNGVVYNDLNQNCIKDELGLVNGVLGIIQPGNIVVQTNANGVWYVDSLPIGNYTISFDTTGNWLATCPNSVSFSVIDPNSITQVAAFGMLNTNPCPEPNVSIFMPFIRPGLSNQTVFVSACNAITATGAVNNGSLEVMLDDLITVNSASLAYTNLGNNTFSFDVGNVNPGECVDFSISTSVSISAVLGQTLCMEALMLPVDSCALDSIPASIPPDFTPCSLPWDNSSILLEVACINDSIVFTITNTGSPGNGDMDCYSPVRLYIDGAYIWLDSIQLLGGESFTYGFLSNGQTWHMEVDQHPLHPGNSNPNATIELCGNPTNWTPNLVNIFPLDDLDPVIDIYCGTVTGSYDPNDKTGFPLGVGIDHLIEPNGKLDYVIRFQNTGTDTAFTVVIRDTLDFDLDIFSLQSGVSSHPYSFRMYGPRVLEWTFNNILLPDSTTNEPASNGFVTFTVDQMPSLPDNTEINNTVGIYFDFNPPIITNTTSHIVSRAIQMVGLTEPDNNAIGERFVLYPNPTDGAVKLVFENEQQELTVSLLSINGQLLKGKTYHNTSEISFEIEASAGVYLLKLKSNSGEETIRVIKQ